MTPTATSPRPLASTRSPLQGSKVHRARRQLANALMWIGSILATLLALIPLLLVLGYVLSKGLPHLNLEFFTTAQKPAGETGGGMKHAIAGTLILIGLASCIGLPLGVLGGIYLAEYGGGKLASVVRFSADVLNGVPSIVIGIFVYAAAVYPVAQRNPGEGYSALAGGLALGIMMVPTIMRTTEEIVRLVPMSLREASLALGATRWFTTLKIVLGTAKGGVITGILLALARVAGETAPLLFTSLGNNFFSTNLRGAMASLPVTIFNFATSADDNWNALAWTGSLVLVLMIFMLSLAARYFTRNRFGASK